jgi:hypothetical protein
MGTTTRNLVGNAKDGMLRSLDSATQIGLQPSSGRQQVWRSTGDRQGED